MAADKAGVQNWIRKITGSGPSPLGPGYVPEVRGPRTRGQGLGAARRLASGLARPRP